MRRWQEHFVQNEYSGLFIPRIFSDERQQVAKVNDKNWQQHWNKVGQPWRREPEITGQRQKELGQRLQIKSDSKKGAYPFAGMILSRADIEWLISTMRTSVNWNEEHK